MRKILPLFVVLAALAGCSNEPRDATNDPEVKAMLKGVEEQGKMPANGGGAQPAPTGGSAAPTAATP